MCVNILFRTFFDFGRHRMFIFNPLIGFESILFTGHGCRFALPNIQRLDKVMFACVPLDITKRWWIDNHNVVSYPPLCPARCGVALRLVS